MKSWLSNQHSILQTAADPSRRKLCKAVGVGTAAGLMGAPTQVSAACGAAQHHLASTTSDVESLAENLKVSFVDSTTIEGFISMGQVTIVNSSDRDVEIRQLYPAQIQTANGYYDIGERFSRKPIMVGAGGQYHFWVRPKTAHAPSKSVLPGVNSKIRLEVINARADIEDQYQIRAADIRFT